MLILAMWDIGQLLGMPAAGIIIHYSARADLPPYPVLFFSMAVLIGVTTLGYAMVSRRLGRLLAAPA
jgi:lipid-A-disaccharide synthase-like uncharacterized protein